jgi:hypothetical protein
MTDALADELERLATAIKMFRSGLSFDASLAQAFEGRARADNHLHLVEALETILSALREREPVAWQWELYDTVTGHSGLDLGFAPPKPVKFQRVRNLQPLYTAPTEHQEKQS